MNKLLSRCIAFAATKHADQIDKSGQPYILHPLRVMSFLKDDDDVELKCIAVLHDVVEDTDTTYEELVKLGCTARIILGVKVLTRLPGQTEAEYQDRILRNPDAMKVKLCDLRHNMDLRRLKGITEKDMLRLQKYAALYHTIKEKLAQ